MAGLIALALAAAAAQPERALELFWAPVYPPQALASRIEGQVACQITVGADGSVIGVALDPGTNPVFAEPVAEAARRARFAPAPETTVLRFVYRFALAPEFPALPRMLAAHGRVNLRVLEAGTRLALPGASVVAVGLASGGTTDARGRAELTLPAGEEELLVFLPEHAFGQVRLRVAAGETASETVYLFRTTPGQFSATVPGERLRNAPVQTELTREELRNVPGTNEDPLRVVELLPGVARAPFKGGQLLVRGARPEDTGAYINGQRIPVLYHLLNGPSVLSESALERIDFLAGGAGAFYGRNLAAVVSVVPRTARPDGWHGLVAVDVRKSSAFLEAPLGERGQFFAAGRVSYVNPIDRFLTESNRPYYVPVYGDYQGGWRHRFEGGHSVGLLAFGSEESFAEADAGRGLAVAQRDRSIGFHRLQLLGSFTLSPSLTLSATPLFGYDHGRDRSSGTPGLSTAAPQLRETTTLAAGLRSELAWRPSPALDLRAGIDTSLDRVRYRYDVETTADLEQLGGTSSVRELRDGVQRTAALGQYVEASLDLGALRVTPGLRAEVVHWEGHTRLAFEPRIWLRAPVGRGEAFAYAGLYHQPPQPVELDARAGNPGLSLERATQLGVGIEQRWDSFSARLEGFYQRRSNLVFPAAATATPDGRIWNPHFLNSGIGRSYGIELLLRRQLSGALYGWIAYTLSRTEQIPRPGEAWEPGPFDQTHILSLVLALRISTQIELSTRLRVATGNPDRQVVDAVFDSTTGRYLPVALPLGSQRLPAFAQLDFEVNNIWTAELYRLALYVDLQNVLNRRNGEVLVYDYRFQQQDVVAGPPISAAVGARVTF